MLNVLEFSVLTLIMSGLAGWVCLNLGKNMKHEVHVMGRRRTLFFQKNNEKQKRKRKKIEGVFKKFISLFVF